MFNPMHPGEILKKSYLEPLNISVVEAARRLNVSRKALSQLINGHSGVSTEMACKLAKACGTTPKFWLNLQINYDLWNNRNFDVGKVASFG